MLKLCILQAVSHNSTQFDPSVCLSLDLNMSGLWQNVCTKYNFYMKMFVGVFVRIVHCLSCVLCAGHRVYSRQILSCVLCAGHRVYSRQTLCCVQDIVCTADRHLAVCRTSCVQQTHWAMSGEYSVVGRAIAHVVNPAKRVQFQAAPFRIWGGPTDTGRGFPPSTRVFPCQYHSTIDPY